MGCKIHEAIDKWKAWVELIAPPGYHHDLAGSLPGWRTPKPAPPTNRYAMPCVALGYVTARQCSRLPPPRLLRRSMAASSEYVAEDKLQVLEFLCCERWAVCIPAMYKLNNVTFFDFFALEKNFLLFAPSCGKNCNPKVLSSFCWSQLAVNWLIHLIFLSPLVVPWS